MPFRRVFKRRGYRAPALIATLVAAASSEASAECRVNVPRAHLASVRVEVSGNHFAIGLDGVPAQIRPANGTADARVDVLAPLRFTASYPSAALRFQVGRPVELYGGRIRLGAGAMPKWLGARGNALEVALEDLLQVSVKEPLRVPCTHVGLSEESAPFTAPELLPPPEGRSTGTGDAAIPLYLFPVEADPITVRFPGAFTVESRRPGWVLLNASWADGSSLRGWTSEKWVGAQPAPIEGQIAGMTSAGVCGRSHEPVLATFTVRRGAPIAAAPGGTRWAKTVQNLPVQAFPLDREDGWIRIGTVPGLAGKPCEELEHLWVHARDLLWPPEPS